MAALQYAAHQNAPSFRCRHSLLPTVNFDTLILFCLGKVVPDVCADRHKSPARGRFHCYGIRSYERCVTEHTTRRLLQKRSTNVVTVSRQIKTLSKVIFILNLPEGPYQLSHGRIFYLSQFLIQNCFLGLLLVNNVKAPSLSVNLGDTLYRAQFCRSKFQKTVAIFMFCNRIVILNFLKDKRRI